MTADDHRRRLTLVAAGLIAVAALLRLHGLGRESLWVDEGWSAWVASGTLADLWRRLASDVHPPLYALVLHAWNACAGSSEVALRLPSAVCGIAALAVGWRLGSRLLGERVAVFAVGLMTVSGFLVFYAQEARSYSLLLLLTILSMLALDRLLERDTPRRRVALAAVDILLVWTHYFAIFVLAAQWFTWLITWLARRRGRGEPGVGPACWVGLQLIVAVASLPLVPLVVEQYAGLAGDFWVPPTRVSMVVGALLQEIGLHTVGGGSVALGAWALVTAGLLVVLTGLAAAPPLRRLFDPERHGDFGASSLSPRAAAFLAPWLLAPVLLPLALSWLGLNLLTSRNLIVIAPALAYLLGVVVAAVPHPSGRMLVLAGLAAMPLAGIFTAPPGPVKEPWRETASQLRRLERPGDAFVLDAWFVRPVLEYYLGTVEPSYAPFDGRVSNADRVWLVRSHSRDRKGATLHFLARYGFRPVTTWSYRGIELILLVRGGVRGETVSAPTTTMMSRNLGLARRRSH